MKKTDDLNGEKQMQPQNSSGDDLARIADGILLDTRARLADKPVISMPIAELATLGAGVASLLPAFRTVTQTTTVHAEELYRLANAGVGDALKVAKNGNFWGAFKTAQGTSKFAQLQAAGFAPATSTAIMPINPAILGEVERYFPGGKPSERPRNGQQGGGQGDRAHTGSQPGPRG